MEPGALGRRRRRGGTAFNPLTLFANSEAGAWYDPSDLTAEKVAWRRNLLTWSEDFTNAAWTNTAFTITANAAVAPDGTTTADALVPTTSNTFHRVFQNATRGGRVMSAFVRANGYNKVALKESGTTGFHASFDLSTVAVLDASAGVTASIVADVGGWYRIVAVLPQQVATIGVQINVLAPGYTSGDPNSSTFAGDGTSGIFAWGAQADVSALTAYQRITDFTTDFLAAFPTHALYQDSAGTTPVTALGQPVGLAIDKSRGGLASLGANIQNGGFDSDTVWTKNGWTISGGSASYASGAGAAIEQVSPVTLAVGDVVRVTVTVSSLTGGFLYAWVAGNATSALGISATRTNAVGTYTWFFPIATLTNQNVGILCGNGPAGVVIDNVSIQRVPGVHAIQPTSASRPLLDGRVNLLTRSEEFNDAAWSKTNVTVAANAAVAPDNTTTADEITDTSATGNHEIETASTITPQTTSAEYDISWRVKKSTVRYVAIGWWRTTGTAAGAGFDLDTGTVTGTGAIGASYAAINASMTALGNGWYECRVRVTGSALGQLPSIFHRTTAYTGGASTFFGESYVGSVSNKTLLWGADLRLATDAAYPYQRVAAATDYADVGVPRAFAFDGFDDSLYTASNMDLSGTDKVTVLAGVRKLSDAARGAIVETGASYAIAGGFGILASETAGANYQFGLGGSTGNIDYVPTGFAAPITNVLTSLCDLAGTTKATELIPRVNGTVSQTGGGGTVAGAGNFSSAVVNIGRRNNASLPLNGKAYQLIVRGALTDTATLAQAERYVGAKTGLYI